MFKGLVKDSVVYGLANAVQKLVPLLVLPLVTQRLGPAALKLYDVCFVYAYLFSWLVVLGQDAAGSVFYFGATTPVERKRVIDQGLLIQLTGLLLIAALLLPFRESIAVALFSADAEIAKWWLVALAVIPGHVLLNFSLNVLLWQRRRFAYVALCTAQTVLSLGSVYLSLVAFGLGVKGLFYSLIGSVSLCGLAGLWTIRKNTAGIFQTNTALAKKMIAFGLPFALTAFCQQLLPSIDRYFLLQFGYNASLPQYALAVKVGGLMSVAVGAFGLAFTPYSMSRVSNPDNDAEMSALFRVVTVVGFAVLPAALLVQDLLLAFFADASFALSKRLLPFFLFGWLFDLFSYFSILGVYRSQRSAAVLVLFAAGLLLVSALNLVLIPRLGLYGAALAFCLAKGALFLAPLLWFRRTFFLRLHAASFAGVLLAAAGCCWLFYVIDRPWYVLVVTTMLATVAFYLWRQPALRLLLRG